MSYYGIIYALNIAFIQSPSAQKWAALESKTQRSKYVNKQYQTFKIFRLYFLQKSVSEVLSDIQA